MNKIPKCRSKYYIAQANNIKPAPKDSNKEHLVPKITQKNLKFSANRQFGKDITNSNKGNTHNNFNNHTTKIVTIVDKKSNNNVYIKKHSSASQVSQKSQKLKIGINDKKLRENKSGSLINKKSDISTSDNCNKNNNNLKQEYIPQQEGSKLHSSISFGINTINTRLLSNNNNNSISVRLSNPKNNNKVPNNINTRSININNNNYPVGNISNNNKIEITHSNLDLM